MGSWVIIWEGQRSAGPERLSLEARWLSNWPRKLDSSSLGRTRLQNWDRGPSMREGLSLPNSLRIEQPDFCRKSGAHLHPSSICWRPFWLPSHLEGERAAVSGAGWRAAGLEQLPERTAAKQLAQLEYSFLGRTCFTTVIWGGCLLGTPSWATALSSTCAHKTDTRLLARLLQKVWFILAHHLHFVASLFASFLEGERAAGS